jgi:hypothetical protein
MGEVIMNLLLRITTGVTLTALAAYLVVLNLPGRPVYSESVSYEDVIKNLLSKKPDRDFERAAVIREDAKMNRHRLRFVYLDANNDVLKRDNGKPYGEVWYCNKFDTELQEAFGSNSILVVE